MQVTLNILTNAINNTSSGQVAVKLKYENQDSTIRVSCSDTGSGIKSNFKSKIFTLFNSFSNENEVGLGLFISKQILHNFDQQINFKTKYGKGSTFMFNFPLEKTRRSAEIDVSDVWEDTGRFKGANQLNEVSFRQDIQKVPSNDSSDVTENLSDQSSLSVHILRP